MEVHPAWMSVCVSVWICPECNQPDNGSTMICCDSATTGTILDV